MNKKIKVYRNGRLLKRGKDYTYRKNIIYLKQTPRKWTDISIVVEDSGKKIKK